MCKHSANFSEFSMDFWAESRNLGEYRADIRYVHAFKHVGTK